jgi:hypothetical protein
MLMRPPEQGPPKRGLMVPPPDAYAGYELEVELRRFLWGAVLVLAAVLWLMDVTAA